MVAIIEYFTIAFGYEPKDVWNMILAGRSSGSVNSNGRE